MTCHNPVTHIKDTAVPDGVKRVFNHDLMVNRGDVDLAHQAFPDLVELLDWERMRETFFKYETEANHAKRHSRRLGIFAIILGFTALSLAALEPRLHIVFPSETFLWALSGVVALLGTVGVVLGSSILVGSRKDRWLHSRAATERLRQLHFQVIVRRANLVGEGRLHEVIAERDKVLNQVARDLKPGVSSLVESIIGDLGGERCWLVQERPSALLLAKHKPLLNSLFESYAQLRFKHQVDYAARKLAKGAGLWPWEPQGQARRIEQASYSLGLIVVLCHVIAITVITIAVTGESWIGPTMQTTSMLAAMGVLALKVLQDGLRPRAEVIRLRTYQGEAAELLRKFQTATDLVAKIALMERMEELSYRELREFLTLHEEASFVL